MKKMISVFMVVMMLAGMLALNVSAENDYSPEKYSEAEYEAGFSFKYIYVVIKNEYSFQEFTPESFNSELVERIEAPYKFNPDNMNYNKDTWELFLKVYLKEQTYENVLSLYKVLKASEYVKYVEISSIYINIPLFAESAREVGRYEGHYTPRVSPDNEDYITAGSTMIRNPYYKVYYNELLEHCVAIYNQLAPHIKDLDYPSYYADNYMNKDKNYVTLILDGTLYLEDCINAKKEYNTRILEKYFAPEDILYVADTTFSAVVEISKENKDILKEIEELAFVGDAFYTINVGALAVVGEYTLGNVTGQQEQIYYDDASLNKPLKRVNAADARMILRYSAGLEKIEKEAKRFFYCADMNFDGSITSADARLALRTAAGLEPGYDITFGYSSYWGDMMGSSYKYW